MGSIYERTTKIAEQLSAVISYLEQIEASLYSGPSSNPDPNGVPTSTPSTPREGPRFNIYSTAGSIEDFLIRTEIKVVEILEKTATLDTLTRDFAHSVSSPQSGTIDCL